MLCEYGCDQEAKYKLTSGKYCCCSSCNQCPEVRKKNSLSHCKTKECPICHKQFHCQGGQYNIHISKCESLWKKKTLLETKDITKYLNWYNNIIKNRQENPIIDGYKELHHIKPRSLGGTNEKNNLIYLTAKEHYICHMLLVEIYSKDNISYQKMLSAFMMMKTRTKNGISVNSRIYENYKKELSKLKKNTGRGSNNNNYGKIWIYNPTLDKNKFIKKEEFEEYEKNGWEKGKCVDLINYKAKKMGIKLTTKFFKRKKDGIDVLSWNWKKQLEEKNKNLYLEYYKTYKEFGWKGICEKTNYNKSRANLISQFKRYLKDDFIPKNQNAKKYKGS